MGKTRRISVAIVALLAALQAGCSSREMVLELQGSVLYEKPTISKISYTVADRRADGAAVVVQVTVDGDPGLDGSFDITPRIVERHPMRETVAGRYVGEFAFPADVVGGPYTVVGRLRHERAGEVILRDPTPLTISLFR